jgi:hypothetical protein
VGIGEAGAGEGEGDGEAGGKGEEEEPPLFLSRLIVTPILVVPVPETLLNPNAEKSFEPGGLPNEGAAKEGANVPCSPPLSSLLVSERPRMPMELVE